MAFRDFFRRKKQTPEEKRREFIRTVPEQSAKLTVQEIAAKQKKARQEAEKAQREETKARQRAEKAQREREQKTREAKREASGVKVIAAKSREGGVRVVAISGSGEKLTGTLKRKPTRKGDSRTAKKKKPNERTRVIGAR